MLGESVPADIDGRVLREILSRAGREVSFTAPELQPVETGAVMSAEEQAQVFERLKGLGYIE